MKEVFNTYVDNAFGEKSQAEIKFNQFELNYKKYFPINKKSTVLDIGVGRGEMLSSFVNWGYSDYLGIDISPSTIKFCKSIDLKCELVDDTTNYLKDREDSYDVITLLDVLEHIPRENVVDFLVAIRRSLKPKGILIIQVPNLQSPDGQLHMYNDITHMMGYIEHSLQQLLMISGFSDFQFQGFEQIPKKGYLSPIRKILRWSYWKLVRFSRLVNGNLNPKILHPVFSAIVKK